MEHSIELDFKLKDTFSKF